MIYAKTWEGHAFQQKPIDPPPTPGSPACVTEPWRNLSFSVERRRDFITIGSNVRKSNYCTPTMHYFSSTVTFPSVIVHFQKSVLRSDYTQISTLRGQTV